MKPEASPGLNNLVRNQLQTEQGVIWASRQPKQNRPMASIFQRNCPLCDKLYAHEYSYNRHVKYCQRAQTRRKGRPTSCASCSKAKVKCNFACPCLRCEAKGLTCSYGKKPASRIEVEISSLDVASPSNANVDRFLHDYPFDNALSGGSLVEPDWEIVLSSTTFDPNLIDLTDQTDQSYPTTATSSNTSPKDAYFSSQQSIDSPSTSEISNFRLREKDLHMLYRRGFFKPAARLVSHTLLSFPRMMLRRQTFPPFIHPHWESPLPENLASCMSVAQLFVSRTPETLPFLWRTLDAEEQRFLNEMMAASARDVFYSIQAMVIYFIMAVIENDTARGARMIQTIKILSARFRLLTGEHYCTSEEYKPSLTWNDWIFAESRRRFTWLWIILTLSVDADIPTSECGDISTAPLMSSKTMWEARTSDEWRTEKAFYDASGPLTTLGELIEARQNAKDPLSAQRLQGWNAGSDQIAVMLNIVLECV